ncbi:cytochrome P450 [Lentzea sp. NBC_00516]|uniref:cytochrome P450 n=1 Tax=Lentzea sp. NBC_00516 TaxID=2903582 RepID=UPI002E81E052|nr:cytochrome P450 [Lentzea sp. NBC_00516]
MIGLGTLALLENPDTPARIRDTDDPDTLDIDRKALGHMVFGHGVHQCPGQTLARAELEIALPTLLRRLPGLRLAVPLEEIRAAQTQALAAVLN